MHQTTPGDITCDELGEPIVRDHGVPVWRILRRVGCLRGNAESRPGTPRALRSKPDVRLRANPADQLYVRTGPTWEPRLIRRRRRFRALAIGQGLAILGYRLGAD